MKPAIRVMTTACRFSNHDPAQLKYYILPNTLPPTHRLYTQVTHTNVANTKISSAIFCNQSGRPKQHPRIWMVSPTRQRNFTPTWTLETHPQTGNIWDATQWVHMAESTYALHDVHTCLCTPQPANCYLQVPHDLAELKKQITHWTLTSTQCLNTAFGLRWLQAALILCWMYLTCDFLWTSAPEPVGPFDIVGHLFRFK